LITKYSIPGSLKHTRPSIALFKTKSDMEQITKADRNACHALCRKANPAPYYGGLVPPLYSKRRNE